MATEITPWFELVDQLRDGEGLSQDDLAYAARQHGAPSTLTGSWISQLRAGKRPLSIDILRGIAGALGVEPERFAEYRLAVARCWLDENQVGLEMSVGLLEQLKPVKALAEDPGEAIRAHRAVRAAQSARAESQQAPSRSAGKPRAKASRRRAG